MLQKLRGLERRISHIDSFPINRLEKRMFLHFACAPSPQAISSFSSQEGKEQIFMHGQKDMDVRIKNVRKEHTGSSQHLIVGGSQFEKVSGDVHQEVGGAHKEKIAKDHHQDVGGNDLSKVANAWQVTAGQDVRIESGTDTEINTAKATSIAVAVDTDQTGGSARGHDASLGPGAGGDHAACGRLQLRNID
jgi:type VI secretion system secreted protein VgrG